MKKDPVVHFEMHYEDHKKVTDFYSGAFGWKLNIMGRKMGDYMIAATAETHANNMVKTPGIGMCVSFTDAEGNRLSILQPKIS